MGAFEGQVALVTGGASGIGAASAARLAAEGARVAVLDVADGSAVAAEFDGLAVTCDVSDPESYARAVAEVLEWGGRLDIAHLNAGVLTGNNDVLSLSDEQYRRIQGVNLDGVVFGVRAVGRHMSEHGGGRIAVTASQAGLIAWASDPIYTTVKHAVVGLVRSSAPQLEAKSITINAVCPGIVNTPMLGGMVAAARAGTAAPADAGRTAPPAQPPTSAPAADPSADEASGTGRAAARRFSLIKPEEVANAVHVALTSGRTGECWVVTAGKDPVPHQFAPPTI